MKKYAKSIVAGISMIAATGYVIYTGQDPEAISALAAEWEMALIGVVNVALVYFIPND